MTCKQIFLALVLFYWCSLSVQAQRQLPDLYGFRHYQLLFRNDTVDVLVQSRKGDEQAVKPLLLFCQGSLPQPLIKLDGPAMFGVFPFSPDSLCAAYHLVIVSKPGVPLVRDQRDLAANFTYPRAGGTYAARNYLDYYVARNRAVLRFLRKQPWVSSQELVVAGHSEGSTVAARLAATCSWVTQLIYSGGNPSGRVLSIIAQNRATETDSTRTAEAELLDWKRIAAHPTDTSTTAGDPPRTTYTFSQPTAPLLRQLRIPVLITYGTKDWGAPYVDLLRVELIQQCNKYVAFRPYIGMEHNFFPLLANGRPDYAVFNWDWVAGDWLTWLRATSPRNTAAR